MKLENDQQYAEAMSEWKKLFQRFVILSEEMVTYEEGILGGDSNEEDATGAGKIPTEELAVLKREGWDALGKPVIKQRSFLRRVFDNEEVFSQGG